MDAKNVHNEFNPVRNTQFSFLSSLLPSLYTPETSLIAADIALSISASKHFAAKSTVIIPNTEPIATISVSEALISKLFSIISVPDRASGNPNVSSGVPNTTSGNPDTSSGVPDTSSGVPDTSSGMPDTSSGDPDTTSGDPDTSSGDPDTTSGDPDTTLKALIISIEPFIAFLLNFSAMRVQFHIFSIERYCLTKYL